MRLTTLNPALWWLALLSAAQAQNTELSVSPALACLTPAAAERGAPEYPPDLLERKDGGTVDVELVFDRPDRAPSIKWRNDSVVFAKLEDAVAHHVRRFRVPCLKPGDPPVVLRQQYVFVPNDGRKVMAAKLTDQADQRRKELLKCMSNADSKVPNYPEEARRNEEQGSYFMKVEFTAADAPPRAQLLAGSKQTRRLRRAVEHFVDGLRLPCLPAGESVSVTQLYKFRLDGGERTVLRDTNLLTFLRSAKKVPTPVYFDLDSMACPFSVRIHYAQPYAESQVNELETSNAARRPLLDWLSKIELNLPEALSLEVMGDSLDLRVPCGKINL